jgi:hypothetical protein
MKEDEMMRLAFTKLIYETQQNRPLMICAENKKRMANCKIPSLCSPESGSGRCQEGDQEGRRRQKAEDIMLARAEEEDDAIPVAMSLILATESNEEIAMNEIPRLAERNDEQNSIFLH